MYYFRHRPGIIGVPGEERYGKESRNTEECFPVMLKRMQQVARFLRPVRPLLFGVAGGGAIVLVALLAPASHYYDLFFIPTLIGVLWCLNGAVFIDVFRVVPEEPAPTASFLQRVKSRLYRCSYWLVALVLFSVTGVAGFMSVKLLVVWLQDLS